MGHRYDRRILLGCVLLPITAIPGTDPIFIWLPLRSGPAGPIPPTHPPTHMSSHTHPTCILLP